MTLKIKRCYGQYPILDWWEDEFGNEFEVGKGHFRARMGDQPIIVLQRVTNSQSTIELLDDVTLKPIQRDNGDLILEIEVKHD